MKPRSINSSGHRHQNVKSPRARSPRPPDHDPRARAFQIIPVALEHRVLQELDRRLEAHLHERTDAALEARAVERQEPAAFRHHVADEVQVAVVDGDAVAFEDGVHFADDGGAAGLHAVDGQHGVDVVGEEFVRVENRLVGMHGAQVDARREHDRVIGFDPGGRVTAFLKRVRARSEAGDTLDDGFMAGAFNQIEDEYFGREDIILEREFY